MYAKNLVNNGGFQLPFLPARPSHRGDVDGMLLDALVAHCDHQCQQEVGSHQRLDKKNPAWPLRFFNPLVSLVGI